MNEDVFPIEIRDFPMSCLIFGGDYMQVFPREQSPILAHVANSDSSTFNVDISINRCLFLVPVGMYSYIYLRIYIYMKIRRKAIGHDFGG